jgi:hypothetical protein
MKEVAALARSRKMTVSSWVRSALKEARSRFSSVAGDRKLQVVRAAAKHLLVSRSRPMASPPCGEAFRLQAEQLDVFQQHPPGSPPPCHPPRTGPGRSGRAAAGRRSCPAPAPGAPSPAVGFLHERRHLGRVFQQRQPGQQAGVGALGGQRAQRSFASSENQPQLLPCYVGDQLSLSPAPLTKRAYQPRGISALQLLFKEHFQSLTDQYEDKYAIIYGRFRIMRIIEVVEKFIRCGDYSQGIARIQCTNPDCKHEYFRPFSCKSFYFCPSCSPST